MVLGNFEWSWTEDGWMGCSRWGKVQQVHIGSALHNASTPLLLQPAVHQLYSNLASATPLLQVMAPPPSPGKLHFVPWPAVPHNHTQLRSSVPGPIPLLLLCLIEPAQLFAHSPLPPLNPNLPPSSHNLTCCFQMHSVLRPLL